MPHKQAGYQAGSTATINLAILHGTLICQFHFPINTLQLNNGGWVTRSTAKAINGFLGDNGLSHLKVRIFKGEMLMENLRLKTVHYFDGNKLFYTTIDKN